MDEVKVAVAYVYSHIVSYALIIVGGLTLFKIVFAWSIPLLGVLVFFTLLIVHMVSYKMLSKPIKEAKLENIFRVVALAYIFLIVLSLALIF
ncbi:MAG: hypothetical protein ACXQTP_04675 [Candidatus Methanofastidiosia archaeon]